MNSRKYRLNPQDHEKLSSLLGREPDTVERVLALALWNEHCSYRSSKKHLKKFQFPTQRKISGLGEQAGVIDLGRGERICFKMESHNHPSYLIPYHGAATGVGGILRDIFAMNARPIALANYLCFAGNFKDQEEALKKEHAGRVDGVVKGISDYGNCMGIPTVTGRTEFSEKYKGNILVNAMAVGYLDSKTRLMSAKTKAQGSYVVYVGSATGRDGILGADMASQSFKEESSEAKPTVQIGDPFFGKQLMEACLESMRKNLVLACQDMGAAGLTCSSFEMSDKAGRGLSLHLDQVPLRDQNLKPEEILLSESQERMLLICKPSDYEKLKKIFDFYELEIRRLGEVLPHREMELYWKGERILKIDPKLFTSHSPVEDRPYIFPKPAPRISVQKLEREFQDLKLSSLKSVTKNHGESCFDCLEFERQILLRCLSSAQGRSREFIYRQYDQRVGTSTVKDASFPIAVLRLPESQRELGISLGGRPYLMDFDVEQGAKDSVFYPALQLALRGFEPLAVTDCLNFGNPEKESIMGEFVLSVEEIAKACQALDSPVISGNVSFYNESERGNITSSPAIGMIGLKENSKPLLEDAFTKAEEKVYLIHCHQFYWPGAVSNILKPANSPDGHQNDQKPAKKLLQKFAYGGLQNFLAQNFIQQVKTLMGNSFISSSRLVGKFGLAYSLARMAIKNNVGFSLDESFPLSLFQERLYEAVLSVESKKEEAFIQEVKKLGLLYTFLGKTHSKSFLKLKALSFSLEELKDSYFKDWSDLSL